METFVLSIVASLAASCIIVCVGWMTSEHARHAALRILSRVTHTGVERVFATQREANYEVARQLTKSRWLHCFLARGNELTRDTFSSLWCPDSSVCEIRLLFPDPNRSDPGSWFADRIREVASYDPGYRSDLVVDQVRANIKYILDKSRSDGRVQVRLYDFPHLGRMIITDRGAFITVYSDRPGHGSESPCIVATSGSAIYAYYARLFDKVWSRSVPVASKSEGQSNPRM
jgi:hypothetical protein